MPDAIIDFTQIFGDAGITVGQARRMQEDYEREQAERRRLLDDAYDRARSLLAACLPPALMTSYTDDSYFEVISNRGRRWRIMSAGQSGNVHLMKGKKGNVKEASFCAHPRSPYVPNPDAHLVQALTLVTDEDAFLAVACCQTPGWQPPAGMRLRRFGGWF